MILLSLLACSSTKTESNSQGIKGTVLWFEGNQMPGFDRKPDPGKGIAREIHIYEVCKQSEAESDGIFFKNISTKLVAIAESKNDGNFEIDLPPGDYSLFVKEEAGLFANIFDMYNHIHPVKVETRKYTEVTISVNYKASY